MAGRKRIPDPIPGHRMCVVCNRILPYSLLRCRETPKGVVYERRCAECVRARAKASYWDDPEAQRDKARAWRANNKQRHKAYCRTWNDANRDRINAIAREKVATLSDSYIRARVVYVDGKPRTLSATEIPAELVALKRAQLKIKRELKEKRA